MEDIRWYDKTPDLSEIFAVVEKFDSSIQAKIAQEIIQMLINEFGLNLDKEINRISKNYNFECKRWYDNNIDLFSSFEIIKYLPDNLKIEVVKRLVESVWIICVKEGLVVDGK